MLRLVRRSLAAASLLLLLATVAVWVRGYWRGDEVSFTTYAVVPESTPDPGTTNKSHNENSERAEDREVRKEQEARAHSQRRTNCYYEMSLAKGGVYLSCNLYEISHHTAEPELVWESEASPLYFAGIHSQDLSRSTSLISAL